jgi:hypothetical protein
MDVYLINGCDPGLMFGVVVLPDDGLIGQHDE